MPILNDSSVLHTEVPADSGVRDSPSFDRLKCESPETDNRQCSIPRHPYDCFGCGRTILDRYFLLTGDRRWHASCLKCTMCRIPLDAEVSCFFRDGGIYCKEDYYKMFIVKRCTRCGQDIFAPDLVMRVKDDIYHARCFTCAWCNITLVPGDYFGIIGSLIYCRTHFSMNSSENEDIHVMQPPVSKEFVSSERPSSKAISLHCLSPSASQSQLGQLNDPHFMGSLQSNLLPHPTFGGTKDGNLLASPSPSPLPKQKGRPRKRKALLSMTASGLITKATPGKKGRPRKQRVEEEVDGGNKGESHETAAVSVSDGGGGGGLTSTSGTPSTIPSTTTATSDHEDTSCHGSSMFSSSSCSSSMSLGSGLLSPNKTGSHNNTTNPHQASSGVTRSKRMRTSFKHHQLKKMKAYFSINHNPDSKDLKGLSLETGLPKRVLQVWFQNARAKWRRSVLRQQSMGPHIVEESQPLSELSSSLVSSNHQRDTDSSHLNLDSSFIPTSPVNGVNHCNNSGNNNASSDSNPTGASCRYFGHGSMMVSSAHHHPLAHQENQENPFFDGSTSRVVKSADSPLEMIHEEPNFSFLNMIRPLHMF